MRHDLRAGEYRSALSRERERHGPGSDYMRQAFHHPRTSIGAAGHWIHLLSVTAPLVIPELIESREKQYKALRLTSVGAALASEAVWTLKLMHDREREEKCRAAAAEHGAER